MQWFNPRAGGALIDGTVRAAKGGSEKVSLGSPPNTTGDDWVVLLKNTDSEQQEQTEKALRMGTQILKISLLFCLGLLSLAKAADVAVKCDPANAKAAFAVGDIEAALASRGHRIAAADGSQVRIVLASLADQDEASRVGAARCAYCHRD